MLLCVLLAGSATATRGQSPQQTAATLREAVQIVEDETGGRILSAETVTAGETRMYRIKVLTPEGTVRIVQVMASSSANPS